jgi:hypothetical protein
MSYNPKPCPTCGLSFGLVDTYPAPSLPEHTNPGDGERCAGSGVIGVAVQGSIKDPFTGVVTVEVRLL